MVPGLLGTRRRMAKVRVTALLLIIALFTATYAQNEEELPPDAGGELSGKRSTFEVCQFLVHGI